MEFGSGNGSTVRIGPRAKVAERLRGRSAELDRGVDQAFEKVRRRQTNLSDCDSAQSVARENSSGTKRSASARLSPRNRALSGGGAGPYLSRPRLRFGTGAIDRPRPKW